MTATAEHLGVGIGQGLAQVAPAAEAYEGSPGFKLLVKGMTLRMQKIVGEYNPSEKADDYMKRLMEVNTPVIDSAVDWKSTAEKKVRNLFRGTYGKRARLSETPKDVSLGNVFTQGETLAEDAASSNAIEILGADGRRLDEDQDSAAVPQPSLATAFDANVWHLLDGDKLSTAEIQKAVDQAAETPRRTGHSDADFDDDVDASGDQQVDPGDV